MEKYLLPSFTLKDNCLSDQIILITGTSRGIGRTLAIAAAKYGATVILLGKNLKQMEQLYDEIVKQGYPEPAIHPLNLLHLTPQTAAELTEGIGQMFGRLNAVIHNAAISGPITPLEHLPPHKWQEVLHTNLDAPYLLTQALLPILKQTPFSSVLFTTDESHYGKAYWAPYAVSKIGLQALAYALHEELENNTTVRVNCFYPGELRTALRVNAYPGIDPTLFRLPEEVVLAYIYLLTTEHSLRGKYIKINF